MSMGTGINLISNKWAGIDASAVKQVSAEIMQRAEAKSVDLSQVNLAAFKRPELGVDFYSGKTSVEAQKQISLTNINMQVETPISTGFLNAQAASALYAPNQIVKSVEGKIQPPVVETERETVKDFFNLTRSLEVYSTAKDKKGSNSNPFSNGQKSEETADNKEGLNIVC